MSREKQVIVGLAGAAALLLSSVALAGPEWEEDTLGDAGPLPDSAQTPNQFGPLNTIYGELSGFAGAGPGGDFQDMFKISITSTFFEIFTDATPHPDGSIPNFDTQLFLFDENGFGVLGNNDVAGAGGFSKILGPILPGTYFLAISGLGSDPVSDTGLIFDFATPTEVSGPDGPGGADPIVGWSGPGETGFYSIQLIGAEFVPGPGAFGLFAACGLIGRRRRRRQA